MSENVHKFAELSQCIVVEKSVIQKYEKEITQHNTIKKSTTEISVENSSRMMSSSSSLSSSKMTTAFRSSTDQLSECKFTVGSDRQDGDVPTNEEPSNNNQNGEIIESDHQTSIVHDAETVDDDEKITTKKCSKMRLSKITTNGSESTKSNANTPDSVKSSDLLSQFTMTPTSKMAPAEVTRPLKPQSEMDFAVPYNIINNYFSVGVVSVCMFCC